MLARSREAYEAFFEASQQSFLYAAPWWLDAACGTGAWDVFVSREGNNSEIAFIPYHNPSIRGMKSIINPPMTQWLPVLKKEYSDATHIENFLSSVSGYSILDVAFKTEPEQLISSGSFRVNLKYSFIIPGGDNITVVKSKYNEGLRRNLKEAEKNYSVLESNDIETFLLLCISTYHQRGMKMPVWVEDRVPAIYDALIKYGKGRLDFALYNGKPIAGILTGWDDKTAYYLIGGRTADEGGASAHALLLDHAIGRACDQGLSFDFEGSMNPGIANFFQSFGATPQAYWQIRKFKGMGKWWSMWHK